MRNPANKRAPPAAMAVFEDVEPRILYSADTGVLAYVPGTTDAAMVQIEPRDVQTTQTQLTGDVATLVVVDGGLPDVDLLLNELEQRQQAGEAIDWLILDTNQDGLAAITSYLAATDEVYSALHVVTHGDAGSFDLGNQQVDLSLLRLRASEFSSWSDSLSGDADLLIYGCDLTSVQAGRSLIDGLSALTSADVAASSNTTGHVSLGGDWTLETQSGSIEAATVLSVQAQASWVAQLTVNVESDPETVVNETTSERQDLSASSDRQVATNGTSTVIVWESEDDIYFRLFNADGSAQGGETLVANGGVQRDMPTVAMASDGSFVIAWVSKNQDGDKDGIYAQRFSASGLAQIPGNRIADPGYVTPSEFRVHLNTTEDQDEPSVALLSDGRAIVSWSDNAAGKVTRVALIEVDGSISWDTQPIVTSGDQKLGVVSVNPINDQPVLAIQHASAAGDALSVATIQTSNGVIQGSVLTIDSPTFDYIEPAISINSATEQMVIAYMADNGGDERVFFSRVDIAGGSGPTLINATPIDVTGNSDVDNPDVAFSDLNNIVVVWEDKNSNDIFARQYDGATGLPVGSATTVNSITGGGQDVPNVVLHGSTATTIWFGAGPGDDIGIFQRQLELASPGVQVTPSGLTTSENGSAVTFSVVLTSQPTGNVQVDFTVSDPTEATRSPGTVVFAAGDWDTPKIVTVAGVTDGIADGDQSYSVSYTVNSVQDALYGALSGETFNMANLDIDGVTISPVTDSDVAANTVTENAPAMTNVGVTALATDLPNTVTYAFESPSSLFAIDANSGVVSTLVSLDYESATSHDVVVQATSSGVGMSQATFTIDVGDLNDEPPVITPVGFAGVDENVPALTPVVTLTAADADAGDTLQNWQVTGGSGAVLFALDPVSGQITVSGPLDYETATSYTLDVTVDDAANNTSVPVTITISLNDLNDVPPVVTSTGAFNIDENSPATTPVGTLSASDADAGDSLQNWQITGGTGAGIFSISPTGQISAATVMPDFEAGVHSFTVLVTVQDANLNTSAPHEVTVDLNNVVEALTISSPTDVATDEDTPVVLAGSSGITLVDGEDRTALQISISVDRGTLTLSQTSGLSFSAGDGSADGSMSFSGSATAINQALDALEYAPQTNDNGVANLAVSVSDPLDASREANTPTLITITAVNDPPVVQGSGAVSAEYTSSSLINPGILSATDIEDSDATLTYTVTTAPELGVLTNAGIALELNDTFTQADIETDLIGYQNTTATRSSDSVVLTVTDSGGAFVADVQLDVTLSGSVFAEQPVANAEGPPEATDSQESESIASEQAAVLVESSDDEVNGFIAAPPPGEFAITNSTQTSQESENNRAGGSKHLTRNALSDYSGRQFLGPTTDYESWRASQIDGEQAQPGGYGKMPTEFVRDFSYTDFTQTMDGLREQMANGVRLDSRVVGSSFAVSAGLSVGYVLWLLRGGVLLSSVIASMPAWRSIDPLPVLASLGQVPASDGEDDSLEDMLDDARESQRNEEGKPSPAPHTH